MEETRWGSLLAVARVSLQDKPEPWKCQCQIERCPRNAETVTEIGRQKTPEGYRDTIETRDICRDGNTLQRDRKSVERERQRGRQQKQRDTRERAREAGPG